MPNPNQRELTRYFPIFLICLQGGLSCLECKNGPQPTGAHWGKPAKGLGYFLWERLRVRWVRHGCKIKQPAVRTGFRAGFAQIAKAYFPTRQHPSKLARHHVVKPHQRCSVLKPLRLYRDREKKPDNAFLHPRLCATISAAQKSTNGRPFASISISLFIIFGVFNVFLGHPFLILKYASSINSIISSKNNATILNAIRQISKLDFYTALLLCLSWFQNPVRAPTNCGKNQQKNINVLEIPALACKIKKLKATQSIWQRRLSAFLI